MPYHIFENTPNGALITSSTIKNVLKFNIFLKFFLNVQQKLIFF